MTTENRKDFLPEITMTLKYDKRIPKSDLIQIRNSNDMFAVLSNVFSADTFDWKEEMIMICLSKSNKVLGFYKVSSGGISSTICDPKIIFTVALNCGASSIVIAHNHPSGNLTPSDADLTITKKIKEGACILDMQLIDHLILADEGYFSFADHGKL